MKNKIYEFYSNDIEISSLLKNEEKLYKRIINTLNILGSFNSKIEVNVYELKDDCLKVWCTDLEDNIFIFNLKAKDKNELYMITHITNNFEKTYDISLAKKFELNKDNVNYIRSAKTYNCKFGRLITDEKTFYSVYLGNNIGFQLCINYSPKRFIAEDILSYLNSMDNKPSFLEFIKMFEELIEINDIKFEYIEVSAYKDFKRIGHLKTEYAKNKTKKLV